MRQITRSAAATMLVVGLFAGTIGTTAGSASATARTASNVKYCKAVLNIGSVNQPPTGGAAATALGKKFAKLAKVAPTPALKKALLRIAANLALLGKGKAPDVSSAQALAKAYTDFGLSAAKCVSADVTLPGGGTIPIPGG
jgi:hypothetical protein